MLTISPTPPEPARFAAPPAVLARAVRHMRVAELLTVSEAALKWRKLDNPRGGRSGDWSFDDAPYLRRPMDCLTPGSGYSTVAVQGPSQCGKSEVGNNWLLHTVKCDPGDMIMLGPDKDIVRSYVVSQINKMIRMTPALKQEQLATPSADNIFSKEFVGTNFFAIWPSGSQMRARPVPKVRIDDYDAVPEDIDGEGNALVLLSGRQISFEGYQTTYVNSSPRLGPDRGIEGLVSTGTNERWSVVCAAHCGERFLLDYDEQFHFERRGSPDDAADSAHLACPRCGGVYEPRDKKELMATGEYIGEGQWIEPRGRIGGALARNTIASFRFLGIMAFPSWPHLAKLHRAAEIAFETTQDEADLRAYYQSHIGLNYKSRLAGAEPVDADELKARAKASDYKLGTVPPGVVCLTAAIDVQGNRFEVEIAGWGEGRECWIVDRYPILALDDGETAVNPAGDPTHWGVLVQKVIWRRWPFAGDPDMSLAVLNTAIDTGGMEGVTDNAYEFWYAAAAMGVPATAITLVKGGNRTEGKLLPPATLDAKTKLPKGKSQAELFVPNVHRLKNTLDVRLRRQEPGPGFIHLPSDMAEAHIDEITAEKKVDGLWTRPRGAANETWDLLVYNNVALIRHAGTDTGMAWVPAWARPDRKPATAPDRGASPQPVRRRRRAKIRVR